MEDIWVGDELIHIGKASLVKVCGMTNDNRPMVQLPDGTEIQCFAKDLVENTPENQEAYLAKTQKSEPLPNFSIGESLKKEKQVKAKEEKDLEPTIDLHFDKLGLPRSGLDGADILKIQLRIFKKFISAHEKKGSYLVKIIHGKGKGRLQSEVHEHLALLERDKRIYRYLLDFRGGMTEVYFRDA